MSKAAESQQEELVVTLLQRVLDGQRELLAELKRRRKGPRKRAAAVARRAFERAELVPITDLDVARAHRSMRRRRR